LVVKPLANGSRRFQRLLDVDGGTMLTELKRLVTTGKECSRKWLLTGE
jgi:hypothetical protein